MTHRDGCPAVVGIACVYAEDRRWFDAAPWRLWRCRPLCHAEASEVAMAGWPLDVRYWVEVDDEGAGRHRRRIHDPAGTVVVTSHDIVTPPVG